MFEILGNVIFENNNVSYIIIGLKWLFNSIFSYR